MLASYGSAPHPGDAPNLVALPSAVQAPSPTAGELIDLQSRRARTLKRTGDIAFSLAVLTLGSPVFLAIGLLVKITSRGPVFYVQQRVGRDYRSFGCIKFRTMRRDADQVLGALLAGSPDLAEEFRNDFKLKNDPRITRVGKFLRRSSLDELPQFLNVLRGEMSVVGPRPIVRKELPRYGARMDEVLAVRPGMTGLWQVSGRNNLTYHKRVKPDLRYARHRTFWLDLRIIVRTVAVVLNPRDRGAY
ncbi:MAG: sugar transferase [Cyanobium sp.]